MTPDRPKPHSSKLNSVDLHTRNQFQAKGPKIPDVKAVSWNIVLALAMMSDHEVAGELSERHHRLELCRLNMLFMVVHVTVFVHSSGDIHRVKCSALHGTRQVTVTAR